MVISFGFCVNLRYKCTKKQNRICKKIPFKESLTIVAISKIGLPNSFFVFLAS